MSHEFRQRMVAPSRGLGIGIVCAILSLLLGVGLASVISPAGAETLYSVNVATGDLVTIDSNSGAATTIYHFSQTMNDVDLAISNDGRTLYALDHSGPNIDISTINLSNFQVTTQPVTLNGITPNSDIKPGYTSAWNCGGAPNSEGLAIVGGQLVIGFQMWTPTSPLNCNSLSNFVGYLNPANGVIEAASPAPFDLISLGSGCPEFIAEGQLVCRADTDGLMGLPNGHLLLCDTVRDGRWNPPDRVEFADITWPAQTPAFAEKTPSVLVNMPNNANDVALTCGGGTFFSIDNQGNSIRTHNMADGSIVGSAVALSPTGVYVGLALAPCSATMLGSATVCSASTGNVYSVDGQPAGTFYAWTIVGNGTIVGPTDGSSVSVNAGSAGSFTLTASMDNGSRLAEMTVQVENCLLNCPRTAGFWSQQCAQKDGGSAKFTAAQVTQVAECVDDRAAIFDWPSGTDLASFCAVTDPPSPMDQRKQAKRQFATLLANVCTGQLDLTANNGDKILLELSTPVSCAGVTSTTLGGMIGEVDGQLVTLEGQPLSDPIVKSQYGDLIACLDAINNGIGIGNVCPATSAAPGGGIGLAGQPRGQVLAAPPSPNPFTRSTYFALAVGGTHSKSVDVRVFDVSGRLVRTIATGTMSPGRHELIWDGTSDQGRMAPSGVYYLRSVVGADKGVTRLLFMR